jgi:hypothetical protein
MAPTTAAAVSTLPADLDQVARELAYATAQLAAWTEIRKEQLAKLQAAHDAGTVPTKFSAYGYSFALQTGKTSTTFDAHGKAAIETLKAELQEQGHCTLTTGDPFWVLRQAKAKA